MNLIIFSSRQLSNLIEQLPTLHTRFALEIIYQGPNLLVLLFCGTYFLLPTPPIIGDSIFLERIPSHAGDFPAKTATLSPYSSRKLRRWSNTANSNACALCRPTLARLKSLLMVAQIFAELTTCESCNGGFGSIPAASSRSGNGSSRYGKTIPRGFSERAWESISPIILGPWSIASYCIKIYKSHLGIVAVRLFHQEPARTMGNLLTDYVPREITQVSRMTNIHPKILEKLPGYRGNRPAAPGSR